MAHKLGVAAILTVVVAILPFINPLVARADTFQYTVLLGSTIGFSFTEPTWASSGEVTSGFFSITVPAGDSLLGFAWNSAGGGRCEIPGVGGGSVPFGLGCAAIGFNVGFARELRLAGFIPGSFLAPGTYTSLGQPNITVAITDLSVPEPSSLVLLGTGVLSLFGIAGKKRLSLS